MAGQDPPQMTPPASASQWFSTHVPTPPWSRRAARPRHWRRFPCSARQVRSCRAKGLHRWPMSPAGHQSHQSRLTRRADRKLCKIAKEPISPMGTLRCGFLVFFGRCGNRIKADIGEENRGRRPAHTDRAPAIRGHWRKIVGIHDADGGKDEQRKRQHLTTTKMAFTRALSVVPIISSQVTSRPITSVPAG